MDIRFNGTILTSTNQAVLLNGTTVSGQNISLASNVSGADGLLLINSQVIATLGDINANVTSTNKGIWLNSNTTLGANGNISLVGVTNGSETGITLQGTADALRNNISAQGNITLIGESSNSSHQGTSIAISNASLTSVGNNIEINGSSAGAGYVHLANFDFNAAVGNVSVNAETLSALPDAQSAALSLKGNNTINAKNGVFISQALNTAQGAGIGFRANTTLFTRGSITFQGSTEAAGSARKGIDFSGDNTLNIAKGSQLSFLGENKGAQDSAGGDGITHSGSPQLTVNNDGVLMMEGRSVSGTGIDFSTNNNTLILTGEGDTLIQGSSHAGSGAALSGIEKIVTAR